MTGCNIISGMDMILNAKFKSTYIYLAIPNTLVCGYNNPIIAEFKSMVKNPSKNVIAFTM
jgi:hypothetical protein